MCYPKIQRYHDQKQARMLTWALSMSLMPVGTNGGTPVVYVIQGDFTPPHAPPLVCTNQRSPIHPTQEQTPQPAKIRMGTLIRLMGPIPSVERSSLASDYPLQNSPT